MALSHSPQTVTNDLVFYYDMGNPQKSWKGKPTVNYITSPTEEMARGEFGQYRDLAPTFNTYGLVPYSLSMDMKVNTPGNVFVYMQNGSSTKYAFVGANVSATTEYQRFYFNNITPSISTSSDTAATLATFTGYGSGVNPTVKNIQLELGTFATPFVNGTRSNTQAISNLINNNTITATSLTYAADGTFSFNGSSNNLNIGSFGGYSTNITCEAFFKTTSAATWKNIVCGPTGDLIFTINGNLVNFGCQGNTPIPHANFSTTIVNTGNWFHAAATYDGSTVKIYVNGVLESTTARSGTITAGAKNIGSSSGGSNEYFNGTIDNVKIYNRALSAAEIQQNFAALRGRYGL
jgi:hypothetical protein